MIIRSVNLELWDVKMDLASFGYAGAAMVERTASGFRTLRLQLEV